MLTYHEDSGCGRVTFSTARRIRRELTWKGLERYWQGLTEGLTPRESLHKIITDSRQRDIERKAKARADFILYALPVAKMTVKEFIEANGRDAYNRWLQYRTDEQKRIIKNWGAKNLPNAVSNYVQHELDLASENKDFAFRFWHVKLIQEAIEYGLEYNPEAFNYYKKLNLFS